MRIKVFVAFVVAVVFVALWMLYGNTVVSQTNRDLGVAQVENNNAVTHALQSSSSFHEFVQFGITITAIVLIAIIFRKEIKKGLLLMNGKLPVIMLSAIMIFSVGCRKYDTPEYTIIENHQTAFVIPLEGDISEQAKFDSAEQLDKMKVAAKRIRITKRWDQKGRLWLHGDWIPTIRVITVDRSPITVTWSEDSDNAIWLESKDSVGFSTGFSVTAMVEEKDAAQYLYRYRGADLQHVLDTEGRARFQSIASRIAGEMEIDLLRTEKDKIVDAIIHDTLPFFKERGITITTIGQFGGFTYENKNIQEAIDNVFIAQQEKNVAEAVLAAQKDKNERLRMEGLGEASKVIEVARGLRDAAMVRAEGEANAIKLVAAAANEAASNPVFIQLRNLEVEIERIKRWDGKYPLYLMNMSSGESPSLLLNVPSTPSK